MNREGDNERLLISYLLGELDEEEQARVEERYFNDESFFDQLLVVEDDLIDAYVGGRLAPESSKRFEESFLRSPERRERVDFAAAWSKYISRSQLPRTDPRAGERPKPFTAFEGVKKRAAFFAIAAALVLAVAGSFLIAEISSLKSELGRARSERATLEERQRELEAQVDQERARNEELAKKIEAEDQQGPVGPDKKPPNAIVAFALRLGLLRGSGDANVLRVPPGAKTIRLNLSFNAGEYSGYSAILRTVEGAEVWRRTGLKPQRRGAIGSISLQLPADILKEDDYIFSLTGINSAGEVEDVGEYAFRIVKS